MNHLFYVYLCVCVCCLVVVRLNFEVPFKSSGEDHFFAEHRFNPSYYSEWFWFLVLCVCVCLYTHWYLNLQLKWIEFENKRCSCMSFSFSFSFSKYVMYTSVSSIVPMRFKSRSFMHPCIILQNEKLKVVGHFTCVDLVIFGMQLSLNVFVFLSSY